MILLANKFIERIGLLKITGILLAAGRSSRFGSNKLLARLPEGERIGIVAAGKLARVVDKLLIIINQKEDLTDKMFVERGYETIEAKNAFLGMGNSLKSGILRSRDSFGWIIGLADMPYMGNVVFDLVAKELCRGSKLVAPSYKGIRGHPVGFGSKLFRELASLKESEGAASVFRKYHSEVVQIATQDKGILQDVDYPTDIT